MVKIIRTIIALALVSLCIFAAVTFIQKNQGRQSPVPQALPQETIVVLTDQGFDPETTTITVGSAVRFTNESSTDSASVNSDDYPTNKKYPELNLGVFQKGSTLVHIFSTAGEYTYHNQFQPEQKGMIVVQENP